MHNIYTKIVAETQKFFKSAAVDQAVIGVSGGIDSALCLKLTADALGYDIEELLDDYEIDTNFDEDEGTAPKDVLDLFE